MPHNLRTYFNSITRTLTSKAETAGVFSGHADIGQCREILVNDFLLNHVPARFSVSRGGEIFGLPNSRSRQIDIIINHDMSPTFRENELARCPVESVLAAVSVKSHLNRNDLFDALENLASVPQLDRQVLTTGPYGKQFDEYTLGWPSLFVFAFDGPSMETCVSNFNDFYKNRSVPSNRKPRAVIVNGKYAIAHWSYLTPPLTTATQFRDSDVGSHLFWVVIEMSKGLSWLSNMYVDYAKYYQAAYPPDANGHS